MIKKNYFILHQIKSFKTLALFVLLTFQPSVGVECFLLCQPTKGIVIRAFFGRPTIVIACEMRDENISNNGWVFNLPNWHMRDSPLEFKPLITRDALTMCKLK